MSATTPGPTPGMPDPPVPPAGPAPTLLAILDLQPSGPDRWEAPTPAEGPPRLFGGQVASQALRAAALTVDGGRRPHSLHSYFIRPGRPGTTLELAVERTRDGRSFSTRRVVAAQQDGPIFVLDASFHADEPGDDWQADGIPDVPGPDELPRSEAGVWTFFATNPFDVVPVNPRTGYAIHPCWVRLREPVDSDDPGLHASALTYVSDLAVIMNARAPMSTAAWGGATLDHAVWFHRPARADEWLLFDVEPVTNFGARGLARGTFHRPDGTLVASLAQECLLRPGPLDPLLANPPG